MPRVLAGFLATLLALFLLALPARADFHVRIGPDGLHKQDWFLKGSGDLRTDLAKAADQGKDLILLVEQVGCYYCKLLHEVNFANEALVENLTGAYLVLQLDMYGEGEITDLDGRTMTQEELVRAWGINTTPTTVVLAASNPPATSRAGAEVFRLPGYLKPFQYDAALAYFASGSYRDQEFSQYMTRRMAALKAQGLDPENW